MTLFPAIDLYGGNAVRLFKGNYQEMTVYSTDPLSVARQMEAQGASHIHLVDLEGAKDGTTPHLPIVSRIARETSLFTEIGGGIRSEETVRAYLENGVDRVILGTVAIEDPDFTKRMIARYGDKIAIGADVRDGFISIRGWMKDIEMTLDAFCAQMQEMGATTLICTDISRDGAMRGTNRALYAALSAKYRMQITASGGVSSLDDVKALRELQLYGAIIGKAYYTGALDLKAALEVAK